VLPVGVIYISFASYRTSPDPDPAYYTGGGGPDTSGVPLTNTTIFVYAGGVRWGANGSRIPSSAGVVGASEQDIDVVHVVGAGFAVGFGAFFTFGLIRKFGRNLQNMRVDI